MRTARRILVIGSESRLGAALAAAHTGLGDEVFVTTRRTPASDERFLDLGRVPAGWAPPPGTDLAYLCAGITSLQHCEERPEETSQVNVRGTLDLCRALARAGTFAVFFSTNLVFDGETPRVTVESCPSPRCAYGRQKAAVEAALRSEDIPASVIRLSKVIDRSNVLLNTWREALQSGRTIAPFRDMTMAPISQECALHAIMDAAECRFRGPMHLSAARDISYYEAAIQLAKRIGSSENLLCPTTARNSLTPDRFIPRNTTLAPSASPLLSFVPPEPGVAIDAFLDGSACAISA